MMRYFLNRLRVVTREAGAVPLVLLLVLAGCDSIEERVSKYYESGMTLMEEGATDKAILEFRNALQLDEDHAPSHYALGLIHEQKRELQSAVGRFRKVVEIDPQHVEARLKLANFLMLSGVLDQANEQLAAILRLDPNRADVQTTRAALALRNGDLDEAREALDLALTLDPENAQAAMVDAAVLLRTATPAAALDRVDEAIAVHPANLSLHLTKLQILEQTDDQEGIRQQLAEMIETFPEETRFRESRARWLIQSGDLESAEADLRGVVEARPGDTEAVTELVRLLRRKDGDAAARQELVALAERPDSRLDIKLLLPRFDVETGRKPDAIAYLRDLAERAEGGAAKVKVFLANLLMTEGQDEEAGALVDAVLAEDPENVDALVLRINQLIAQQQFDTAIQEIRKGLNEAPEDVRLLLLAARAHERSGTLDVASDRYAKAVRANGYRPETVETYLEFLMRADRMTAAETVLAEAVARNPGEARLYDLLGFMRVRLENWDGAEQAAKALDRFDPDRARQLRAAILIGQEQFEEGVGLLRTLSSDETRRAASIAAVVQTYVRDGRTAEAEAFLDELIAANPANVQALGIRGNLHMAAGDHAAAEEKYRAILDIDPANGGAHSALARLYGVRGDKEKAEAQLLAGLEASPEDLVLLTRLASLRESQGNFDEAIQIYEKLYRLVPDSLMVANNLASLLSDHRSANPDDLDRAYKIAGRLRPSDIPQYRDTYGWTRYLKGEYEEAEERIAPVAKALPENPWVLYHLGMVHAALGKRAEARETLTAALEKSAELDFPPAEKIRGTLAELDGS